MDALVWLIVYLRRVGMLKGSTSEMLAIASKRPDRRIVLEPPVGRSLDDPLFVHVEPAGSYHTPSPPAATGDSVRRAINTLAVKGGALTRPGAHSLRRGLARDVSKLAASELSTGAGPHVATILGHSDKSTREKLGDHYAGASIENLMNIRAGKLPDNVAPPSATTTSLRYPVGPSLPFPIRSEAPDRLAEQNRKLLRDKLLSLPAWQHKEHSGDSKQHRYQLNMEIDRIEAAAHANGVPLLLYFESSVLGTEINSMDVQISDATVAETDGVDDEFLEQHNIGTGVELSRAAHADVDLAMDIAVNELGAGQAINFKSVQQMMLYEGDGKPVPQDVLSFSGDQLADYFAAYNVIHEPVDWAASAKRPLIEQHLSSRHNGFGRDDLTFFRAFCQQGCGQQGLRVDDVIPELHNCPKKAKTVSDEPIWPTSVAVDASRLETAAMPRIPSKRELSTFDSPQQSPVNSPALRVDSLGKLPQRPVDFRRAQSFSWGVVKQTPVAPNLGESASSSQNVIGQSYVIRDPAGQEAAEHIAPVGTAEFQPRTVWPVPPGWPRPSRCLLHATTGCNFSWSEKSQFVRHATSKVHRLTRADVDTMVANAYNAFIADPHSATPLTAVAAIPVRRTLPRVHAAYWAEMPCPITGCGSKLKGPTLKGILKHLQAERPRGKHALSEAQALKAVEEMFTSFGQTDDTA
nr:hypothetical protein B0A51_11253 [Rachicladosporium sp. CCFEE 5018]